MLWYTYVTAAFKLRIVSLRQTGATQQTKRKRKREKGRSYKGEREEKEKQKEEKWNRRRRRRTAVQIHKLLKLNNKKTVFFKMGNKPEQAPHPRYTDINYAQKMC